MVVLIINATLSFFATLVLHELGHYFAARLCSVPVKQLGLGSGPKLCKFRVGKVDCQIRLFPMSAYVQMDMGLLQQKPLIQQLFVLGAGIGVNLVLCALTWGSLFGVFNLALALGNLIPLYQLDGWKSGMVILRRMFGRPSPLVEWILTIGGGAIGLSILARAILLNV
jgi:membrane-associated protease RseP (regulator of RpoE activity)